jgi:ankyrin repeat protein
MTAPNQRVNLGDLLYRLYEDPSAGDSLLPEIEAYLRQRPEEINAKRGYEEETWLHSATQYRLDGAVTLLLRCGADPDVQNEGGAVPLFYVFDDPGRGGENERMVRTAAALLQGGADPNAVLSRGNCAGESLLYRATPGFREITELLRQHGARLDLKTATLRGLDGEVARLLAESADPIRLVRATPKLGGDAILSQIMDEPQGRPVETLQLLLRNGLDPNQRAWHQWPLIWQAAANQGPRSADLMRALIAAGADVNTVASGGGEDQTALDVVITRTDFNQELAEVLRAAGGKTYAELNPPRRRKRR